MVSSSKQKPDEFMVYSRAPLSLPPDYGLRPPVPGRDRPQNVTPIDNARQALLAGRAPAASARPIAPGDGVSPGVRFLLDKTGGAAADPGIRQLINEETTILAEEDESITESIMFWGTPTEYGTVVDPVQEARRIQENQALGRPLTEGETPTIERRRRALLEGIF